jgi:very-short-patch-repair endonuclease
VSMRNMPQRLGEIAFLGSEDAPQFYFDIWAVGSGFSYPPAAKDFLSHCGSAAEAFFARPFTLREGVEFPPNNRKFACAPGGYEMELQVRCAGYWLDALVSDPWSSLAIEIDGAAWHYMSKERWAADYARQRRIVLKGHTVVRFTAQEAFGDPDECWRQIEIILAARARV